MDKRALIEHIQRDDLPRAVAVSCERLLDYVFAHRDADHIPFTKISRIIDSDDASIVLAVTQYLSGATLAVLDMKFELILDDDVYELDNHVVEESQKTNSFTHPESGINIEGFESFIYPYFVPGRNVVGGEVDD